jgi:glycosyltransferase involved in cell wall biosynthesis
MLVGDSEILMRILLINHFPLTGSGSGVYVKNVAAKLTERGHEVTVLTPDTEIPARDEYPFELNTILCSQSGADSAEGKDLSFPFPCFTTHPRSNRTFYSLSEAELAEYSGVFEQRIRTLAEGLDVEVIHPQHLWVTAAVAARSDWPYVVTCHGTDLLGYRAAPGYRPFAHQGADGARKIVAVSDSTAREVSQIFGVGDERLTALPSGVDGKTFKPIDVRPAEVFKELGLPLPVGPIMVYGGKLACFKGPDILIEAASMYERQMPNVTTVIAGDGSERRGLESMARALHIKNMHFVGWQDQSILARLYSVADLAVVPSREEPFGLVAIEALACGAPVVASRTGGLPEHIDDSVGRLVSPDNPGELAHALLEELTTGGRKVKGAAAAAKGATYTWGKHVDKLLEFYAEAAGN